MMAYFCNGKKGVCSMGEDEWCGDCECFDGSGGHKIASQTNADYIRSMTDEELAALMVSWCKATEDCSCCPWYDNCPGSEHDFDWLDWLQQPYKEDE